MNISVVVHSLMLPKLEVSQGTFQASEDKRKALQHTSAERLLGKHGLLALFRSPLEGSSVICQCVDRTGGYAVMAETRASETVGALRSRTAGF